MTVKIRHSIEFRRRILIISSHEDNVSALREILIKNYEVDTVSTGQEALEKYADHSSYALNIIDLDLPDQNAYDFIRLFRNLDLIGRVPVIAIMPEWGREAETLQAGAVDFIRKPLKADVLLKSVSTIIERLERARQSM